MPDWISSRRFSGIVAHQLHFIALPQIQLIVHSLNRNNRVFSEVVELLKQFPDLDKMLSGLTAVPKSVTPKTAKIGIDTLIFLKQTLKLAPLLASALEGLKHCGGVANNPFSNEQMAGANVEEVDAESPGALLDAIVTNLREEQLQALLGEILGVITESTEYSRSAHEMRHQECFALRNGVHGLLDVARKTFLQTVEDIYALGERYSAELSVTIKVTFNAARGYYLLVPASLAPLPAQFTQTVVNKRTISCSTEEMNSLSDRATEAITQALSLTHELTQELLGAVRSNISCLFSVTDCVVSCDSLV
jgi:DNA mismatch repair protein MSH4